LSRLTTVLSYGGGRQTVAICVLIARGLLPRPDRVVMADTGRENPMTWSYLAAHVRPLLAPLGLDVEVAPHSLATVDLYAHNGDLLLPVHSATGKLPGFCSDEWKRRVVERYLRGQGVDRAEMWIGFALDERRRVARLLASNDRTKFPPRCPLVELMLTTADCLSLVRSEGLPEPFVSSCWMCPNKRNAEWRYLRDHQPDYFEQACRIDEEAREEDIERGGSGVWLHHSCVPLREADLDEPERAEVVRQCGLGMCFV
jgi:hypothetical protein